MPTVDNFKMRRRSKKEFVATVRSIFRCFQPEYSSILESTPPKLQRYGEQLANRIETHRITAARERLASLSSNQVDQKHVSMFIINKQCASVGKWVDAAYSNPSDFEEIVNPVITAISETTTFQEESCPSYPLLLCGRTRFDNITVEYRTATKQVITRKLSGFYARVFQHEFDHIMGNNLLFTEVHQGNLRFDPSAEKQFPRSVELLNDLNRQAKKVLR